MEINGEGERQRVDIMVIDAAKKHLDEAAFKDITCRETNGRHLYACKILRALIDHAVKEEGKHTIATRICDIMNAAPDTETAAKELAASADSCVEYFFLPLFKLTDTLADSPSECQTPISEDVSGDQISLSVLLHRREGEHCIVSESPNIRNITYRHSLKLPAILEVTHILPHFLNKLNLNDDNVENWENAALTLSLLNIWTSTDIQQWVEQNFDRPGNAILATGHIRGLFNSFYIWFEKASAANTYRVQVDTRWEGLVRAYQNKPVRFVDHSDTGIPLPLPEALAIHASFAKVFRDSGTADFFRAVLQDQEMLEIGGPTDLALALGYLVIK